MGLYAGFDIIADFGFPEEVGGVEVDYSDALEAFCQAFLESSTNMCPIDTGYLCSTLDADNDGYSFAEAYTNCEYAQYQEYGTWCMKAQPYFEPALGIAIPIMIKEANRAVREAQEEAEGMKETMGDGGVSFTGGGITGFFGAILMVFAIAMTKAVIKEFFKLIEYKPDYSYNKSDRENADFDQYRDIVSIQIR